MENKEKGTAVVFSIDAMLNPNNADAIRSFTSCEDRCNKLEVRRTKTKHSGG